jgi:drug/metabolite transporter (DMT)-like permease
VDWATLAFLHTGLQAWVSILDKYNVSRLVRDVRTYYLMLGVLSLGFGIVTIVLFPVQDGAPTTAILLAIASGLARGSALMITFIVYQTQEVSRVVPVTQSFPIFVAIIASIFLDEILGPLEWGAILVTVAGVVLISFQRVPGKGGIPLGLPFLFMVGISLLLALSSVLSKAALADISVWNMYSFTIIFAGGSFLTLGLRAHTIREALALVRTPRGVLLPITVMLVTLGGNLLLFSSFERGPVSLASTIVGTRPLFVFIYSALITWLFPRVMYEPLTPKVAMVKLVSIALIVSGGVTLALR